MLERSPFLQRNFKLSHYLVLRLCGRKCEADFQSVVFERLLDEPVFAVDVGEGRACWLTRVAP